MNSNNSVQNGGTQTATSKRYYAIDHLRAAMICVVMFGHALLPYTTVPRRYKDPDTHVLFDALALFLYNFAMPLFFVTAGFAAAALRQRRGIAGLFRNRLQAIFIPLLAAYLLLTPLTRAAYLFAGEVASSGSLAAGLEVLRTGDWIRWSKAYHLWFLVALLLYTAVTILLSRGLRLLPGRGPAPLIAAAGDLLFESRLRVAWLTGIAAVTLVPAYSLYDGDIGNVPMQLHLLSFFLVGWLLFLRRELLSDLAARPVRFIVAAVVVSPLAIWASRLRWFEADRMDVTTGVIAGISNALLIACMTFGLIGLFQRRFHEQPSPWGSYLSEASYWIFLIHFPLMIFVAGALSATTLPALMKYLATVAVVAPLTLATYHFLVRSSSFGRFLKGRKAPR